LSRELHEIAVNNIKAYSRETQLCKDITAINADASELELPPGPLLVFLYNPFNAKLMARFIKRVEAALAREQRDIVVFYCNPRFVELWEQLAAFRPIKILPEYAVLRSKSVGAASPL
jgi:hypothetical protein